MKVIASTIVAVGLFASTPALAAAVSLTFQNVGTADMDVSKVSPCGVFSPTPAKVLAGKTSPKSTATSCPGNSASTGVIYKMGSTKTCSFSVTSLYTPPNPLTGFSGYWTPTTSATASGGATCKVVSSDYTNFYTKGDLGAIFSMK